MNASYSKGSTSEQDFGTACWLIRQGKSDVAICEYLLRSSPNLEQRKGLKHVGRYLERTIKNARRSVEQIAKTYP